MKTKDENNERYDWSAFSVNMPHPVVLGKKNSPCLKVTNEQVAFKKSGLTMTNKNKQLQQCVC